MSSPPSIRLTPRLVLPTSSEFQAIPAWPFSDQPFFVGQVRRLLQSDIPHRVLYGFCRVWVYGDPDGHAVGFGTLDLCKDYEQFMDGKPHAYIPVLAVHPSFPRKGHGQTIVEHLIAESVLMSQSSADTSDKLFLDVYAANQPAISLYQKCGFTTLNPDTPIPDPCENNELYIIMAKNLAIATG